MNAAEIMKKRLQLLLLMNVLNVTLLFIFSVYLDEMNGTKPNWYSNDALCLLSVMKSIHSGVYMLELHSFE